MYSNTNSQLRALIYSSHPQVGKQVGSNLLANQTRTDLWKKVQTGMLILSVIGSTGTWCFEIWRWHWTNIKTTFEWLITSTPSSHHLKLYLNAHGLLLDSSHACGEGLPHASGPSQGQLGDTFKACNGTGQNSGSARSAHEQRADDLPARDTLLQPKVL